MDGLMVLMIKAIVWLWLIALIPFALMALWKTWQDEVPPAALPDEPSETLEQRRQRFADTKGRIGEQLVKIRLTEELDGKFYRVFHNLIVPSKVGGSTQIDHVIVSPYGIFVLETKYFAGWIYGGVRQKTWTHTLSPRHKYSFQNPLHQNYKHIRVLADLLRLPDSCFHSVAVFAHRDCRLKTAMPANVCLLSGFIPYIQGFKKRLLHPPQLQAACAELAKADWQADAERLRQHCETITSCENKENE